MQKSLPSFPFHCLGRGKSLGGSGGGVWPSDSPLISLAAEGEHPFAQPPEGKAAAGSKWLTLGTEGALATRVRQPPLPASLGVQVPAWRSLHPPPMWLQFGRPWGCPSQGGCTPGLPHMAVHHGQPEPLAAPALHTGTCSMHRDCCLGGLSSSSSRSKAMFIRMLYILPQLRMFPSSTQVLFRFLLIHWVSGAVRPVLCSSAFAGMQMGILQHAGITTHCSTRQHCLSKHFLQSIPLPAFKISHLLQTLRLFSFMALYSFNVSMNQILFFVTPISRPRVAEEIYEVTLDLHQDNERKNWPFVFIF